MSEQLQTIEDMEKRYYGNVLEDLGFVYKVDAPLLTTTTGVFNTIFGRMVWAMLNQEANVFGLLPKSPWDNSGWRLITAAAGSAADGGIAEAGTLPDTIKPTFLEVTNTLKSTAHTFEVSEHQQYLSDKDDGFGKLEEMRQIMAVKHKEAINESLLSDVSADAAAATANYAGRNGFETLDRVVSNDSEEDAFGGTYTSFFDIFGLDRDSATTFDAFVDHNSGTDRDITDQLLRVGIWSVKENGGNTTVIVTGYDTYRSMIALYDTQVRYQTVGEATASFGVNGIQTEEGIKVGIRISTIYDIPTIVSVDTPSDTISRIFLLDTSDPEGFGVPRLAISVAKPTQYFESGIDAEGPFAVNKLTTKGMFRTMAEIKSTRLDAQGKIRDLQ